MFYKAILPALAAGALAVSACSPSETPAGTDGADTAREASSSSRQKALEAIREGAENGDPNLALIMALEEHQPELYDELVGEFAKLIDRGKLSRKDGEAAGAALRPKLLDIYTEAMLSASDDNLVRLVEHTTDVYNNMLARDPQECVRNINGQPPLNASIITKAEQERENAIILAIFEEGPVDDDYADQNALMEWMVPRLQSNPEHLSAFALNPASRLSDDQAASFCTATIYVMDEMLAEGPDHGARLFRGSLRLEQ